MNIVTDYRPAIYYLPARWEAWDADAHLLDRRYGFGETREGAVAALLSQPPRPANDR